MQLQSPSKWRTLSRFLLPDCSDSERRLYKGPLRKRRGFYSLTNITWATLVHSKRTAPIFLLNSYLTVYLLFKSFIQILLNVLIYFTQYILYFYSIA